MSQKSKINQYYVSKESLKNIESLMDQINLTNYEIAERISKIFNRDTLEELSIEQADKALYFLEEMKMKNN